MQMIGLCMFSRASKKKFLFIALLSLFGSGSKTKASYSLRTNKGLVALFQNPERYTDFLSPYDPEKQDVLLQPRDIDLKTVSNRAFQGQLFENSHKDVIVVGLGKGATPKDKEPYVRAFGKDYDVFIFRYDWQMPEYQSISERIHPSKRFFEHNHEEVIAVVSYLKEQGYQQVIGLGECYSAYTFAAAEAHATCNKKQLFSKLIFDSCWLSVKQMAASFVKDPWLSGNPLEGGSPEIVKNIMSSCFIFKPIHFFVSLILSDLNVTDYLKYITVPTLFIRGINDPAVSSGDFDTLWGSVQHEQKAALITPFHHSNSFKRAGRNAYLYVANLFIQESFDTFLQELQAQV
jgi:hypothetical protein